MVIIDIIVPVFGIVLLGYIAGRSSYFNEHDVRGLSKFVFNLAIPVMLFRMLANVALPEQIEWSYLLSYYVAAFMVYGFGMLTGSRVFFQRPKEQGVFGLGAAYSNTVLLGMPLILTALGEAAALPLFLLLAFHSGLMFFTVTAITEAARGKGQSVWKLPWITLKGLAKNPIVDGLMLGLLFNVLNLEIPGALDKIAETISGAALPCAVFALGASLSRYHIAGNLPQAMTLVGLKTVLHPIIVWLLATFVFGVDPLWTSVAVIMAAMPVGINAYLFAQRYDVCVAPVATAILLSTGLSVGTVSLLLFLLNIGS